MKCRTFVKSFIPMCLLLLLCVFSAWAQSNTHVVTKGETLFGIAQQYQVEVSQLKKWNELQNNQLTIGQSLVIKKNANPRADNKKIHTVKQQETLFSISKQYGVTISELKSWNDISVNNLQIGQKLVIYPSKSGSSSSKSIVDDSSTESNTYYTVKSGDTLYRIAEAHDMAVAELKSLNDLKGNNISVGQTLTVHGNSTPPSVAANTASSPQGKFITYKVSGGSFRQLLKKFDMTKEEFKKLNPNTNINQLRSGQKVTLLAPPSKQYKNPYLVNSHMKSLGTTPVTKYSDNAEASTTTNGELYNPDALTAAHPNIALGSVIFIKNSQNDEGEYVRINDRSSGSALKLSAKAWNALHFSGSNPTVTIYQDQ